MTSPTQLYLIRHGEVENRYHRIFGGKIDMELSPRGHQQAQGLARYLQNTKFTAIYASPMKRAQQTLAPLAAQHPFPPVTLPDLREVDFGEWTGLSWQEVKERYKVSAYEWLDQLDRAAIPGAESAREFRARVEPCLQRILHECPGQTVVIVCHGGVIRMLLSILLELPITKLAAFDVEYASVSVVSYLPHKTELELLNLTPWRDLP
jgi:alpha-ribazole phosphatase